MDAQYITSTKTSMKTMKDIAMSRKKAQGRVVAGQSQCHPLQRPGKNEHVSAGHSHGRTAPVSIISREKIRAWLLLRPTRISLVERYVSALEHTTIDFVECDIFVVDQLRIEHPKRACDILTGKRAWPAFGLPTSLVIDKEGGLLVGHRAPHAGAGRRG